MLQTYEPLVVRYKGWPRRPKHTTHTRASILETRRSCRRRMHPLPLLLLCAAAASAFPADSKANMDVDYEKLATKYLETFYDLKPGGATVSRKKTVNPYTEKLKQMQEFFGLKVTGQLDAETVEVMEKPRCGVPDIGEFRTFPAVWQKKDLTYRILNFTPDLSKADVEKSIERALKVWSDVSPLTFTRIYDKESDIEISFVRGAYNLFLVAAHEFGHSLGLDHSDDAGALMYPTYSYTHPNEFNLPQDDINAIQHLYGKSTNPIAPTGPSTPNKCDRNVAFDAVTTLRGEMFFFVNRFMWRKHPQEPEPELFFVQTLWPSLPSSINAAYENPYSENEEVLLFKGSKYWAISGFDLLRGYPKNIYGLGFPRTVKAVDAAVHIESLQRTYFFVGNQYWSYNEDTKQMDKGFPKSVQEDFPGISGQITAANYYQGQLYLFSGRIQYQYDLQSKRVIRASRSNSWLGC
uniref:Matrix metallopeptidase 1 n=1 Tax=Leptobrachium leishanense TaxID=445787 RepID=A0A8C5Q6A4_9ANUR